MTEIVFKVENGEDIVIELNSKNQIISYSNPNVKQCGDNFLRENKGLTSLSLPKLVQCGSSFLQSNRGLTSVHLPKLDKKRREELCSHEPNLIPQINYFGE